MDSTACVIARFIGAGPLDASFDGDGIALLRPACAAGVSALRCDATDMDFDAAQRAVVRYEVEDATTQPPSGQRGAGEVGAIRYNNNGSISSTFGLNVQVLSSFGVTGGGLVDLGNGDIVFARNGISNGASINPIATASIGALDPDTTNGQRRWGTSTPWPGTDASRTVTDLQELPFSSFYATGLTGSGRFNHTTAHLGRWTFGQRYSVSVATTGTGLGTVTGSPGAIDCGSPPAGPNNCFAVIDEGLSINLTATPGPGSFFGGWSV